MRLIEVLAHEGEEVVEAVQPSLDEVIRANSLNYTLIALGLLLGLAVLALIFKNASDKVKYLLFGAIAVVVVLDTVYLAGSTLYLNQQSQTGGPVHYHADFEIYNCGQKIDLKDPEGFSNKVGSEVVHEHNDDRIHIEGVLLDEHDASLSHFFAELGGSISEDKLTVPTEDGLLTLKDGGVCADGQRAQFQVFVYQTKNKTFSQQKLEDPKDYVISPYGQVPPGDCIIIELDKSKERTDKLCTFYQVAKQKGELVEE